MGAQIVVAERINDADKEQINALVKKVVDRESSGIGVVLLVGCEPRLS